MVSQKIRSAFVLGAGLGTRLRPLTAHCPKPLVPVCNRPLISYAFDQLLAVGVERIVINTHHCADQYTVAFPDSRYRGTELIFRHEPELLETGGGIKNVEDLLGDEPFLIYNGDVLADFAIAPLVERHFAAGNEVTLGLRSFGGPLRVAYDADFGLVTDITNLLGTGNPGNCLFTGVYVVNSSQFKFLKVTEKVSVKLAWIEMIRAGLPIGGWMMDHGDWHDLGTRDSYLAVQHKLTGGKLCVAPDADVDASAQLHGMVVAGAGSKIGRDVRLEDCVLWPGAEVVDGADLRGCVVTDRAVAVGTWVDKDF